MRISELLASCAFALVIMTGAGQHARAFDGTPTQQVIVPPSPSENAREGMKAYHAGKMKEAVDHWTKAAESGDTASQFRLASMFQLGQGGLDRDDSKAFRFFRQIVESRADDDPGTPQSNMTGKAFVQLGAYYLKGIPGTEVKKDAVQAWRLFYHAASVFGDAEAQYNLARLYLTGEGVEKNAMLAARWLRNAAEKGHKNAQATLGELLFVGEQMPGRHAEGLMWLSLAREKARGAADEWIITAHDDAYTLASDEERAEAVRSLRRWARMSRD